MRGVTLLELAVVVIAIGVLAGVALDRLLPLVDRAHRTAFLQVQRELQSALLLEAAARIARGDRDALDELAAVNPMTLLLAAPANYLGSREGSEAADVAGNSWYYDERQRRLVYRVGKHTRFEALDGPSDRVELRVRLLYRDRDGDGIYEPPHDEFDGLRLEPVHAYRWSD